MNVSRLLFGASSPLIVDYEESLLRLSLSLVAAIDLGGPARLLDRGKLLSLEDGVVTHADVGFLPCAFSPARRRELHDLAVAEGFRLAPALVDLHSVCASSSRIGDGSFLNASSVVGGASIIGTCVVVNRLVGVGHHCVLSNFSSVGPGATLAGNVRVGEGAVIGAGAVIQPDVRIGDEAVVSAGSVVRRDVAAGSVVAGNPARELKLKPSKTQFWTTTQE